MSDISSVNARFRMALIDSQPMFRAGVAHTLRTAKAAESITEGENAADALQIAGREPLDIMLLDLAISGGGADAVSSISRLWPAIRLIILTASERAEDVSGALQCGARGYILKHASGSELLHALRSVAVGEVYLTPSLGARLFARSPAAQTVVVPAPQSIDLTPREDQILAQVSVGATNKEIANTLKISEKTVKYYMTNIMQKLQVRNRVEAVVAARSRINSAA